MQEECKWQSFLVLSMPVKSVSSLVRARRKMAARRTKTAASAILDSRLQNRCCFKRSLAV